jgi:hypothetical protein
MQDDNSSICTEFIGFKLLSKDWDLLLKIEGGGQIKLMHKVAKDLAYRLQQIPGVEGHKKSEESHSMLTILFQFDVPCPNRG